MTKENCRDRHNSRTFARRVVMHVSALFGFVATIYAASYTINGTSICMRMQLSQDETRKPAMLRLNESMTEGPTSILHPTARHGDLHPDVATEEGGNVPLYRRFGLTRKFLDFSRGLNFTGVDRVNSVGINYGAILPSRLSPATSGANVAAQIFDHSVSNFFKQEGIKNSFVGRAATTVEQKMKAEVAFGGSTPSSIKHGLKFQVKATQTKATMEYKGLTNAELSYSIGGRKTDFEVYEPITDSSKIVYTHSDQPNDRRDFLSLRMNW